MSPQAISTGSAPAPGCDRAPRPFVASYSTDSEMSVDDREAPEIFGDLNLNQIVDSITAGRDEYNLKPFFYAPLSDVEAVHYRYEILRDLEDQAVAGYVRSFADEMREMRRHLSASGQGVLQIPEAELVS